MLGKLTRNGARSSALRSHSSKGCNNSRGCFARRASRGRLAWIRSPLLRLRNVQSRRDRASCNVGAISVKECEPHSRANATEIAVVVESVALSRPRKSGGW